MTQIDQGLAHHQAGRFEQAEAVYRQILAHEPNHPDALHLLGVIAHQGRRHDTAVELIRKAIEVDPHASMYHNNFGEALRALERFAEAVEAYQQALAINPAYAEAYNNLGLALHAQGQLAEAVTAYQRALALQPDFETYYHLGNAFADQVRLPEAIAAYRQALALKPDMAEAHCNLGVTLEALGNAQPAADAFINALRLKPNYIDARRGLVSVFNSVEPESYQPNIESELMKCFDSAEVAYQSLARIAANQLKHKHSVRQRLQSKNKRALIEDISRDRLLLAMLAKTFNVDPEFELVLTETRRVLFFEQLDAEAIPELRIELIAALGLHCLSNAYVFSVEDDEQQAIHHLKIQCERAQSYKPSQELENTLLLLSMYIPLHTLSCASGLEVAALNAWSTPVRLVIQRALKEPLEERAIAQGIESLGKIHDPTSRMVRKQYEENPYPPWEDLPGYRKVSLRTTLRRHFPHFVPPNFVDGPTRVLVAGCGTARVPINIALVRENTEVVAQDLSRRSIAYGTRMARKLGANNVRFIHGDLLELHRLNLEFHVIECTGVLHHMKDPVRGWWALTDLLVPGGLMRIGLYSDVARSAVRSAREQTCQSGLTLMNQDIRRFRSSVLTGSCAPELSALMESQDFYNLNACRDLLFHVQEHRFTLPEIWQVLDELGLEFIGFELPGPCTKRRYQEFFATDDRMTDRAMWERFENRYPQTFAGMYMFWCQRKDTS